MNNDKYEKRKQSKYNVHPKREEDPDLEKRLETSSFRGKWFEIASWKSSDSIKSDLPIKSEDRALKGFTSSHFFSLPLPPPLPFRVRKFRRKIAKMAATISKNRSIDIIAYGGEGDAWRRISLTTDRGTQR